MIDIGCDDIIDKNVNVELLTFALILSISSTCLCRGLVEDTSGGFNVLDYGAVGDGQTDDSQAFSKAWTALCQTKGTPQLIVPSGKKFLLMPVMFQGPCQSNSVQVQILGTMLAPNSMDGWRNCSTNCWLRFSGVSNLNVSGSGTIDGRGSTWWNHLRLNHIFALQFNHCNNLQLSGLTHLNSPKNHISLTACNGASLSYLHISAPASSPNTDGIDISSSTNINIHDSDIATGDDCIAINGNSAHINITGINCGPGHGISVGSLGRNGAHETVEYVYVQHCNFTQTQNGARIKTWPGGSGYARYIYFQHIQLQQASNPIIIDQFYCDYFCIMRQSSAVKVSNVTYMDIKGTSGNQQGIIFNCDQEVCTNIIMDHINIRSSNGGNVSATCKNVKGQSSCTTPEVPCLSSNNINDDCDNQKRNIFAPTNYLH
ncbi:probable polygalacturonase At3g15720 [Quercus lobata]|uniref:probable polygalacturonase At3g15720 n=1 Tax=Quercus lobata TaxID=97700 RepID=UPI001248A2AE|nr:probable polygalacturonase At3g15720 [Quercus lobata]